MQIFFSLWGRPQYEPCPGPLATLICHQHSNILRKFLFRVRWKKHIPQSSPIARVSEMATQSLSFPPTSIAFSTSGSQKAGRSNRPRLPSKLRPAGLPSSFLGDVAFLRSTNPSSFITRHQPLVAARTVFFMLPTA